MKYLILFLLFSLSVLAGEFPVSEGEVAKGNLAKTQMQKLNQLYTGLDTYCDNSGHHIDLVAACKAQKGVILNEYSGRLGLMIREKLEQGLSEEKAKIAEAKCVDFYRGRIDEVANPVIISYLPEDNCDTLKNKWDAYIASLPPAE